MNTSKKNIKENVETIFEKFLKIPFSICKYLKQEINISL